MESGQAQAPLHGHDQLEARFAGHPQPTGVELHARCAEPGLNLRHLLVDSCGPAVSGHRLDLFNREVVGWLLRPRMTGGIVTVRPWSSSGASWQQASFITRIAAARMPASLSNPGWSKRYDLLGVL